MVAEAQHGNALLHGLTAVVDWLAVRMFAQPCVRMKIHPARKIHRSKSKNTFQHEKSQLCINVILISLFAIVNIN